MTQARTKQLNIDDPFPLPVHVVASLPTATVQGETIYVVDEVSGGVPAFWDGVNWLRVTDRQIVS